MTVKELKQPWRHPFDRILGVDPRNLSPRQALASGRLGELAARYIDARLDKATPVPSTDKRSRVTYRAADMLRRHRHEIHQALRLRASGTPHEADTATASADPGEVVRLEDMRNESPTTGSGLKVRRPGKSELADFSPIGIKPESTGTTVESDSNPSTPATTLEDAGGEVQYVPKRRANVEVDSPSSAKSDIDAQSHALGVPLTDFPKHRSYGTPAISEYPNEFLPGGRHRKSEFVGPEPAEVTPLPIPAAHAGIDRFITHQ